MSLFPAAAFAAGGDAFDVPVDLGAAVAATVRVDPGAATLEPGEPVHPVGGVEGSVWLKWRAPATGMLTVENASPARLTLYTGEALDRLFPVAWNGSLVVVPVAAGVGYRIAVTAGAALEDGLDVTLSFQPTSGGYQLGEGRYECVPPLPSALFVFRSPGGQPVCFDGGEGSLIEVYDGQPWSPGVSRRRVTGGPSPFSWHPGAAGVATVRVRAAPGGVVSQLGVSALSPPANDALASPAVVSGESVRAVVDLLGATVEPAEPREPLSFYSGAKGSVYYAFTPPETAYYRVNVAEREPGVSVPESLVSFVSRGSGGTYSQLPLTRIGTPVYRRLAAGGVTLVRVAARLPDRRETFAAGSPFDFVLEIDRSDVPPLANDDFVDATELGSALPVSLVGHSIGATEDFPPRGDFVGQAAVRRVWYRWTAPRVGSYRIRANGEGEEFRAEVFRGGPPRDERSVGERFTFAAGAGERFWIGVSRQLGLGGFFLFEIEPFVPPQQAVNDRIASAIDLGAALPACAGAGFTGAVTREEGEPVAARWWKWTAPEDGIFAVLPEGLSRYAVKIYREDPVEGFVDAREFRLGGPTFAGRSGETYLVALTDEGEPGHAFAIAPAPFAENVSRETAVELGIGAAGEFLVAGAYNRQWTPRSPRAASYFYRWNAPAAGLVWLETVVDYGRGTPPERPVATLVREEGRAPKRKTQAAVASGLNGFGVRAGETCYVRLVYRKRYREPARVRLRMLPLAAGEEQALELGLENFELPLAPVQLGPGGRMRWGVDPELLVPARGARPLVSVETFRGGGEGFTTLGVVGPGGDGVVRFALPVERGPAALFRFRYTDPNVP